MAMNYDTVSQILDMYHMISWSEVSSSVCQPEWEISFDLWSMISSTSQDLLVYATDSGRVKDLGGRKFYGIPVTLIDGENVCRIILTAKL